MAEIRRLSPLEELPRELIWMLIEYAPEAVYDLRLVRNCEIINYKNIYEVFSTREDLCYANNLG